jgi:hypothetical protein
MANGGWQMANVKEHTGTVRANSHSPFTIRHLPFFLLTFAICHLPFAIPASATPTQEEVFQSIQNNLGPQIDGSKVFALFLTAVGVAMILVVLSKRQKRAALPQKLNHQGKLMRELIKSALGTMVEQLETAGQPLRSPLTLMLCPSLTRRPPEEAPSKE